MKKLQQLVDQIVHSDWNQKRDFIQGSTRQWIYDKYPLLLSKYLRNEYERRKQDAKECYDNRECLHCGCKTPDLFMADRACSRPDTPCYPALISLKQRIWQYLIYLGVELLNTLGNRAKTQYSNIPLNTTVTKNMLDTNPAVDVLSVNGRIINLM